MTSEQTPQAQINELVMQISQLEARGEQLEKQYETLSSYLAEMDATSTTLEGLGKSEVGTEILVPVGSSSWIRATVMDIKEVIIGLGAQVSAVKSIADAQKTIQDRMKDVQNALRQTGEQLEQIRVYIENMRNELQNFANQAQG